MTRSRADKLVVDASAGELFFSRRSDGTGALAQSQIRRGISWSNWGSRYKMQERHCVVEESEGREVERKGRVGGARREK